MTTQAQQDILNMARARGFHNCLEVFDALGFAPRQRRRHDTIQGPSERSDGSEDAGEEIVRVIPDGESDIPLAVSAQGCYNLDVVVETKDAFYAAIAANEAEAWAEAERRLEEFEADKAARLAEADAAIAERRAEIAAQQVAAQSPRCSNGSTSTWLALGVPQRLILEIRVGDPPEGVVKRGYPRLVLPHFPPGCSYPANSPHRADCSSRRDLYRTGDSTTWLPEAGLTSNTRQERISQSELQRRLEGFIVGMAMNIVMALVGKDKCLFAQQHCAPL